MTRVRITKAAEQHSVRVSNNSVEADIPIDGNFHEIHDDLIPVLEGSAVEFEVEQTEKRPAAARGAAATGGAAKLGSRAAPPKRKRPSRSKKAKKSA